jgi:prolyl-tRNA synthetase
MRVSQFFISTLKEAPSEAELISHRLMLRAGLTKRLASGLYTWMPLGLRVLRKVERIVREEMDRAGAIELSMPLVQPSELWQESGRWDFFGPELLRFTDRHKRDFCLGPTHEEVITDIARREIKSYRQLPVNFYQVQTKFRDEIRPRFGVMRAREFLMKDAYSFHADRASLEKTYSAMYDAYCNIFTRLGLKFCAVAADTGAIGGTGSHEFHVLADSGEDAIAYCAASDYAANIELAQALPPSNLRGPATQSMQKIATPGQTKCEDVATFLKIPLHAMVRAIAVINDDHSFPFNLLLIRGDHQLNEAKVNKIVGLNRFRFASDIEIEEYMGAGPGYIGPVSPRQDFPIIADASVASMSNFVCGANETGFHLSGVNFGRDLPEPDMVADIRNVVAGDPSPDGKGLLDICRGIEVGHIFQLGTKYSKAMNANFLDQHGASCNMEMGCYGIGVSRIVAAAIEQNNDERGILFPVSMAPFQLAMVPIAIGKNTLVKNSTESLYNELAQAGIDVLLDDRDERLGVMLADMELIGIPHRFVIGERGLKNAEIEYQVRGEKDARMLPLSSAVDFIKSILCKS